MEGLTFDELRAKIHALKGKSISAYIYNQGRSYRFYGLKPSFSLNPDICGVSLNHASQSSGYKRSRFHDSEDVNISFARDEFNIARVIEGDDKELIYIKCRTFTCTLESTR